MRIFQKSKFLLDHFTRRKYNVINFGVLFDIDGVLIRGSKAIDEARMMFDFIDKNGLENQFVMAMLTNSCDSSHNKANSLSSLFNRKIFPEQIINASAPLKLYEHVHDKRTLFVCQHDIKSVAKSLNFTQPVTLQEIKEAYPILDVMSKSHREKLKEGYKLSEISPPIESVVILGEALAWESYLQIITDLVITGGTPHKAGVGQSSSKCDVFVCNLDFLYTAEYQLNRYGNGAFLLCLESLFHKLTGNQLKYSAVIGKPSEISYRYAEHILTDLAIKSGSSSVHLDRIYMIGDNPSSDILGANLYNQWISTSRRTELPSHRTFPANANLHPQTVTSVKALLVQTGVYKPSQSTVDPTNNNSSSSHSRHQHQVYSNIQPPELYNPYVVVHDCLEALYRILEMETIITHTNHHSSPSHIC